MRGQFDRFCHRQRLLTLAPLLLALVSCDQPSAPATPCLHWEPGYYRHPIELVPGIELLFVVDPSSAPLPADAIPRLLGSFTRHNPGERSSVRAAVTTTDVGSGRHALSSCPRPFGDDGVFLDASACGGDGRFLEWEPGTDVSSFASQLSCLLRPVEGGCAVRQPLEAALAAISPPEYWPEDYIPPTFASGGYGHGSSENHGFHEDGTLFVVIVISDHDDCSLGDDALFDPTDPRYAETPEALRCSQHSEALTAIRRYVRGDEGSSGLFPERSAAGILFVPIVGIPLDAVPAERGSIDYDAILARDDMRGDADPAMPTRPRASCEVPGRGPAQAPRRILETARELDLMGGSVLLRSICTDDLGAVMDDIGAAVAERVRRTRGPCFRPGFLDGCELLTALPPGERCADHPGLTHAFERDGVEHCYVAHSTDSSPGWFVEHASDTPLGSELRDLCRDDGSWITLVLEGPLPDDSSLVCHRTLAPDGGTCEP